MSIAPLRSATTALASAALVVAPLVAVAPSAAAVTPTETAVAAADWLAADLETHDGALPGFVGTDWGLTADAVLGLQSAGRGDDPAVDEAVAALASGADEFALNSDWGADNETAGKVAKLLLVAAGAGTGPMVGEVDLDNLLRRLMTTTGSNTGRFQDASHDASPPNTYDSSNGFSQSLALLALDASSGAAPVDAVDFLLTQQCDSGGFRLFFAADGAPCAGGEADTDTTGLAVQALVAVGGQQPVVDDAVEWLATQAKEDGSFGGSGPTVAANSNSTGLVAQGLEAAGVDGPALTSARDYLVSLQLVSADDAGAIAYDVAGRDAAASEVSEQARDQFRRATAQAVLGLTGVSLAEAAAGGGDAEEPPGEEIPGEEIPGEELPGEEPPAEEPPAEELPGEESPGAELPAEEQPDEEPLARPAIATQPTTTDVEHSAAVLAAAAWQSENLVDGERIVQDFDGQTFPNVGGTVDVALSFLATDTEPEALERVVGYLDAQAANYTQGAEFVGDGEFDEKEGAAYAGATAKLAFTVALADDDPRDFAGIDLITQLQGLEDESGRYQDDSAYGDYSNLLSQSFGVLALHQADGVDPTAGSVATLVEAQCPDGGFPEQFPTDATCASDPDTTGLVLQALAAVETEGRSAGSAAGAVADVAVEWLTGQRSPDGAWEGPGGKNTNSTGYAAMGLAAQEREISSSRTWLDSVQLDDGGLVINPGGDQADAFATAQAMVALAGGFFADPVVTVPETTTATPSSTTGAGNASPSSPAEATGPPTSGAGSTSDTLASALPRTGTEVATLVAVAALLLGLGTAATLAARRRRGAHQ